MADPTNPENGPLDLADFRSAARDLVARRTAAVASYKAAIKNAAEAEASYQKIKHMRFMEIKDEGIAVSVIPTIIKGDDLVAAALIARDSTNLILRARLAEIEGIDGERAILRQTAEWSQRYGGENQ